MIVWNQLAANEQGFVQAWDLKNVKPGTAADWKRNVQDNNQKPNDVCPARTTAAMLLKMKITMSCPNIAKPHVACMCLVAHYGSMPKINKGTGGLLRPCLITL